MLTKENKKATPLDATEQVSSRMQTQYSTHNCFCSEPQEEVLWGSFTAQFHRNVDREFFFREGKTIGEHAMEVRLNKVKELLVYTDLPTEEISKKLHYPSLKEMEAELLQQTGLSLSYFRSLKKEKARLTINSKRTKAEVYKPK